jgi:acetoin utilization deacetylase AcuC-like enzyme
VTLRTILYSHLACLEHVNGPTHPERPDRLLAIMSALEHEDFTGLERRDAPLGTVDQVALMHPREHVEALLAAVPESGTVILDGDTSMSPGSGEAAMRAVGAACAAVDAVMAGDADNAFCAVRPPGHHAEATVPMGFCLFNTVAIAAAHARAAHGLDRVAVMDFDVHHGNGTQHLFEEDGALFYASTHQMPLYPGTGSRGERGVGNIANAPLPSGAGSAEFRFAMNETILPALREFRPELLIISAGFDAHMADPLAGLNLTDDDYGWATEELLSVARECCGGRLVSSLEGGYDLAALAASSATHVRALMAT